MSGNQGATILLRSASELNTSLLELRRSSVVRFQVSAGGAARPWLDRPARRPLIGQVGAVLGLWAPTGLERGRKGLRSEPCRCLHTGMGGRLCGRTCAGRGVQAPGGPQRGGGLGGVLLGFAEFGDGFGERGQPGNEHDRGQRPVAGQVGERGQQPGGLPELVPGRGGQGDAAIGRAGGTVVGVGGLAQDAAAELAAATCRVSEVAQAASAAAAGSVQARVRICAVASAATRVACSQTAFRSSAVSRHAGRVWPGAGSTAAAAWASSDPRRVSRRRTRPGRRPWWCRRAARPSNR